MGVVSNSDGELLLVRTPRRGWEPPGGQVEQGETLIAALCREVREESGCEVEVLKLVGMYSNTGDPPKILLTFLCRHVGGEPCGGDECLEARWFAVPEALEAVANPAQAAKLRDALGHPHVEGTPYRAYNNRPYVVEHEWWV